MSANRSSTSTEVQPAIDESIQTPPTQIVNQDVKKEDSKTPSKSAHESHQTATSDANKHEFEAKTDESNRQILDSVSDSRIAAGSQGNSPTPEVQPTTTHENVNSSPPEVKTDVTHETSATQITDLDVNKGAMVVSNHDPGKSSPPEVMPTTQIPDSDANKHATETTPEVQPMGAPKTTTPADDSGNSATEVQPMGAPKTTTPADDSGNSATEVQPLGTPETTTPTHDPGRSKTEVQPMGAPETTTPTIHDPGNSTTEVQPMVAPETSTPQVHDSDVNKPATTTPTEDSDTSSATKAQPVGAPETTAPTQDSGTSSATKAQPKGAPEATTPTEYSGTSSATKAQPKGAPEATTPTEDSGNSSAAKAQPIGDPETTTPTEDSGTSSATKAQPTGAPEATTPTQDSGTSSATKAQPTGAPEATTPTQDSGTSSAAKDQPIGAPETSTPQVHDSDVNKPATTPPTQDSGTSSATKVQPSGAPETTTTQTPGSDSNKTATATDPNDPANSSPPEVSPTTQDSTEGSATKVAAPNQESTSTTQTNDPAATTDTTGVSKTPEIQPATDQPDTEHEPNKDTPSPKEDDTKAVVTSDPVQERKHLLNLIDQELKFVKNVCPKLGKHQEHIKKEADDATDKFNKLDERCELTELKDLKKTVTKLKLQIPAKYRTYDDSDQQKNKQFDKDKLSAIPIKFLKKMPRLHHELFHGSEFCKSIQKRYDELSSRELKLCVLCFSVFPENAVISRRFMVYWWIGEGFVPTDDRLDSEKTAEDHANGFFDELMKMDFIEAVSKRPGRNVATCKMHPMIRAALVMIADTVNFFDFDEFGNPKDFGKFDEIESPEDVPKIHPLGDPREFFDFFDKDKANFEATIEFSDENGNPIPFALLPPDNDDLPLTNRDGKPIDAKKKFYYYRKKKIITTSFKVCLMGSGLSKGIQWEKLHMLFNVKDDILEFKPEWFLRMKNVNVVFLGRWQSSAAHHIEVGEFDFKDCLNHMNHIRFFSLQGVSRISELPKEISNLESVQILDLRACHNLETIPKTIGYLKSLTHLDMSECYLLEHMPKEISTLESLQVLKGFVVVESPSKHTCTLNDLRKLDSLRKLCMYTHMKDFPQESHLDALQKLEALRKLTILWGGHESKPKTVTEGKINLVSKAWKRISKRQWVDGKMRRMNAFNSSTLGSRLEKLDLKCFPENVTPSWLTPGSLKRLKKLYIRGGQFSDLGQYQDVLEWGDSDSPLPAKDTWNVEVLRLKYLDELKMDWRELQMLFPKMTSLEKVKCPRLTLFPCDEHGVWTKKPATTRY